jgi:hypothetical protein
VSLNNSTVVGQQTPTGTVTLTAAAPTGGAVVALESSNTDLAKVPANVTVAAGSTTNTFTIDTSTTRDRATIVIRAVYLGVARTTNLVVTPPPLEPNFTVRSPTRGDDACGVLNANGAVDCVFDASTSRGFPAQYRYEFNFRDEKFEENSSSVTFTPALLCGFLNDGSISDGAITISATLRLQDRDGTISTNTRTRQVKVYPNGNCGY